ncbi:flagellar motor switch protein FliM [Erythrobacter crassostreae]|uniref:FliM/FliN family flagellar motor switch protein n=1 Tax=Erythrobacter crassostreae TaxID=2828328 RepID=A0A9X1F420_9SPHN|nr:flagellar motor switch protein FliM [Erythrobacter crassostrea]MBV7258933.1 FliM/FliN family flagellar motor switch protein [Erythrobacter crassostrea]
MSMELPTETVLAGARPLAQHCEQLAARGPRPEERAEALTLWRREFTRALSQDLEGLLAGDRPGVTIDEPEMISGSEVFSRIGPVAANSLLRCGIDERTVLFSIDWPTAIALTDRSFGGEGVPGKEPPEQLPRSAALLVDQLSASIAQAITRAGIGEAGDLEATTLTGDVIVRSESASRLKPFGPDCNCQLFSLRILAGKDKHWDALIAVPDETLDALLPGAKTVKSDRPAASPEQAARTAPFSGIPLGLGAVLAEFELSLNRLDDLAPGDQIPLSVARDIPLRLGDEIIAHGSLGSLEDRMAVRITRFPDQGALS